MRHMPHHSDTSVNKVNEIGDSGFISL